MTGRKRRLPSRGFTLMEILVAIVIFSLLMTTLYTSFHAFVDSSRGVTDALDRSRTSRTLVPLLSRDLESVLAIQPPRYKKPEGLSDRDPFYFRGDTTSLLGKSFSRLSLASLSHICLDGTDRDGVCRVTWFVREGEGDTVDLCRLDVLRPDWEKEANDDCAPILVKNLKEFELVYVDTEGREQSTWDSDTRDSGYQIPAAVMVRILAGDGNDRETVLTRVELMVGRMVEDS